MIPLQPQSGSGPTTDGRRNGPEREQEPSSTTIPMIDDGGFGPRPGPT
jgi:hypothetical protein